VTAGRDERRATSNEAALRLRLRAEGIADLADHAALRRFAAAEPATFNDAILAFAGVAAPPDALAALLLDADLRPDDRLLVAGTPAHAWLRPLARVIRAPHATPATLRAIAEAEQASLVIAPPSWLAAAGLTEATPCGPRGIYPAGWSDATAEAIPTRPTRPGVVPKTVRKAAPKAGTLA
jgi:hypothetical protein